jgi:hypothetical protein
MRERERERERERDIQTDREKRGRRGGEGEKTEEDIEREGGRKRERGDIHTKPAAHREIHTTELSKLNFKRKY